MSLLASATRLVARVSFILRNTSTSHEAQVANQSMRTQWLREMPSSRVCRETGETRFEGASGVKPDLKLTSHTSKCLETMLTSSLTHPSLTLTDASRRHEGQGEGAHCRCESRLPSLATLQPTLASCARNILQRTRHSSNGVGVRRDYFSS